MKDFIDNVLPYYGLFIVTIGIISVSFIVLKDFIIKTFGKCIHLDEIDMIVVRKQVETIQRNDAEGNLDTNRNKYYLFVEKPDDDTYTKQLSVSRRVYTKTRIGDIVKMHEAIYKYKDIYLKSIDRYSESNIDKFNKCQDSDKELFTMYQNDILNKCNEYREKCNKIRIKVSIIVGIGILSVFLMVFLSNTL